MNRSDRGGVVQRPIRPLPLSCHARSSPGGHQNMAGSPRSVLELFQLSRQLESGYTEIRSVG